MAAVGSRFVSLVVIASQPSPRALGRRSVSRVAPAGGEEQVYGRAGLLAHTSLLGPDGDSNGCVSFRNDTAFLHAYKSGQIKRLVVVAKL